MASTTRTPRSLLSGETPPPLRWRSWPLVDRPQWSWLGVAAIVAIGGLVWWCGGGWLMATLAVIGLSATLWQLFVPVDYELGTSGIRRHTLNRTRLLAWHSVRAFQPRSGGIVMFQSSEPSQVDLLRSVYVPYPPDARQLILAVRPHLTHAVEMPGDA